jgi:hypothetical protein
LPAPEPSALGMLVLSSNPVAVNEPETALPCTESMVTLPVVAKMAYVAEQTWSTAAMPTDASGGAFCPGAETFPAAMA